MISIELTEWSELTPAADARLRGYRMSDPDARARAEGLSKHGVLDIVALEAGLSVRSFSFVGRIELGDLTVTVRPKLAPSELLILLRYAYSLQDLRLFDQTSFGVGVEGLQDVLIAQLEAEARELFHRGPLRRYVRRSERLASPRGRIDVTQLARGNRADAATLPCLHYPRSSDFLLNQVVRAGLELARRMTRDAALKRALSSTSALYAEVASSSRLDDQTFDAADRSLDRLTSAYGPAVRIVRILYDASHLSLEQGSFRVDGFMFDMNRFFQTLIGKFLADSLPDWRVESEERIRHMLSYAAAHNPRRRRAPTPRPDFVVRIKPQQAYLLDAKYRDLWRTELPREMLYQLAIYAMSRPAGSTAAILYPTEDDAATEAIINIADPMSAMVRARVGLRPVIIPRLLKFLREPRLMSRERRACAEALVLGSQI